MNESLFLIVERGLPYFTKTCERSEEKPRALSLSAHPERDINISGEATKLISFP